jgi:hypothetical protein
VLFVYTRPERRETAAASGLRPFGQATREEVYRTIPTNSLHVTRVIGVYEQGVGLMNMDGPRPCMCCAPCATVCLLVSSLGLWPSHNSNNPKHIPRGLPTPWTIANISNNPKDIPGVFRPLGTKQTSLRRGNWLLGPSQHTTYVPVQPWIEGPLRILGTCGSDVC